MLNYLIFSLVALTSIFIYCVACAFAFLFGKWLKSGEQPRKFAFLAIAAGLFLMHVAFIFFLFGWKILHG